MERVDRLSTGNGGNEAGNTLVVAILVLFLLTSLGISYVAVTKGDKQVAGNQLISTQAFENAEAGISEVLRRMSDPSEGFPTYIGQTPGSWTPGWGLYVVNDPGNSGLDPQYNATLTDGLNNDNDASIDETSEHYIETGSKQVGLPLSSRLDYPWVKVRYKLNSANQIILFGDHDNDPTSPPRENLTRGIPKIIVTAAGRRGTGAKAVTIEALKWPLPPVPGSVYTEGEMDFSGNSFYIDGHDHNPTAPYDTVSGATPLPGIATPNDPNVIASSLTSQQEDNVQGSGADPSVRPANVNLDLPAIAAAWSTMADITYSGDQSNPDTGGWGTVGDLKIIHVQGDLNISGTGSGAGVLIVDGDFDMGGTLNWNGVIIVLGDVKIHGGGSAKNIVGSLMVQGTLTGESTVTGNVKIMYSSEMISQLSALTQYEISSWIDQ